MSEQSIFSKLTLTTSSLFICSLLLIGLCLSSLIISEKESALSDNDKSSIKSINICNGVIGLIAIIITIFSIYLLDLSNMNDHTKYIYMSIGLSLVVLSVTQFAYISKLSENFSDSSKNSLYTCAVLVLVIGLMFMFYSSYLYVKGYKVAPPAPVPVAVSGDVLADLEKALIKANESAEKALKAYGPKDMKYVEAKQKASAIKDDIDLFASEYDTTIKRSKDVKEKTDQVRGINEKRKVENPFSR